MEMGDCQTFSTELSTDSNLVMYDAITLQVALSAHRNAVYTTTEDDCS